jgi:hypothetical protein
MNDWTRFTDSNGDFQLANFLYRNINDLMKHSLDMGTLLSTDAHKLRAYKEQTKKLFKSKWYDIAQCLEFFDIIEKCVCYSDGQEAYCEVCKGSRYRISSFFTAEEVREVGIFYNAASNAKLAEDLHKKLMQALDELSEM